MDNGTVLLRFSSPNLVSIDDQGQLFHHPDMHGTYVIAGVLITVTVGGGPAECAGQTFALRASRGASARQLLGRRQSGLFRRRNDR